MVYMAFGGLMGSLHATASKWAKHQWVTDFFWKQNYSESTGKLF